jgi:hypothetical protein
MTVVCPYIGLPGISHHKNRASEGSEKLHTLLVTLGVMLSIIKITPSQEEGRSVYAV